MPISKLHLPDEARTDLAEIKSYISVELSNPAAAASTVKNITKRIRQLQDFPMLGPSLISTLPIAKGYRFLVSGNYLIFYRIKGKDIYVDRVLYGRQNYLEILFKDAPDDLPEE